MDKILTSIKAPLGLSEEYTPFDMEVTLHVNSAIATLRQLGVGPPEGLVIDKDTTWDALLMGSKQLETTKSYIFIKVKMVFDVEGMSPHTINAYEKMLEELSWRIVHETNPWTLQVLPTPDLEEI